MVDALSFIEENLKQYARPYFRSALLPDFDKKFRSILKSSKNGKLSHAKAKTELRLILREDYLRQVREVPEFMWEEKKLSEWVKELGPQAPAWLTKHLRTHPALARQTLFRLTEDKRRPPPVDVSKNFGFRLMLSNSPIMEHLLKLPFGTLAYDEGDWRRLTVLPDALFEKAPALLAEKPVRLVPTLRLSPPEELKALRKKNAWPEMITNTWVDDLHDHTRHPYVALLHDRHIHASLLNIFPPKFRLDLLRFCEIVEELRAQRDVHLPAHISTEILEGVFLAPYFKDGRITFSVEEPYRRAVGFVLRAGRRNGEISESLMKRLQGKLEKTRLLDLTKTVDG